MYLRNVRECQFVNYLIVILSGSLSVLFIDYDSQVINDFSNAEITSAWLCFVQPIPGLLCIKKNCRR